MTLVIGLDTGGTYTDAALLDATGGHVLATGKALTTRDDLSIGLGEAIATVLQSYDGPASDIGMVSLSTTLATNAVVEGVGGRVGLFMIGFDDKALERADLARAIGQDPVQFVAGGHRADGGVQEPFDSATLTHAAASMAADVSALLSPGILQRGTRHMKPPPAISCAKPPGCRSPVAMIYHPPLAAQDAP